MRDAIDALKISLWSAETAEAPCGCWPRPTSQAKDADRRAAEAERALALDPSSDRGEAAGSSTQRAKIALSLAAHTQDDGFHEIQLNGKQLVFLFMAATVVSVVIFLCGVLVGRGVRVESERRGRRRRVERRGGTDTAAAPLADADASRVRIRRPPRRRRTVDDLSYSDRLAASNALAGAAEGPGKALPAGRRSLPAAQPRPRTVAACRLPHR